MNPRVTYLANGAIRLQANAVGDEALRHFEYLFEQAWQRIAPEHRKLIDSYWRARVAPENCRGKPNVKDKYDPHVTLYNDSGPGNRGVPKTQDDGHVLLFPAGLLEDMGADFAVIAVAHELAHVAFYAQSEPNHWPNFRNAEAYTAAEQLADKRLVDWGFDRASLEGLDSWMTQRGFSRT